MVKSTLILNITHPKDPILQEKAHWFSGQPGIKLLKPEKKSSVSQQSKSTQFPILQISRKGVCLKTGEASLKFHPNMALLRVIQLLRGEPDRFLKATRLKEGDTFLDATLGLGTDALVAAYQVGKHGQVIGFEHSPILAALIQEGLNSLAHGAHPPVVNPDKANAWQALAEAAQRITVQWGDHQELLTQLPANSVDVIYFDPMFRHTREQSASIRPLHEVSNPKSIAKKSVQEAYRATRKRVVLKERKNSYEFARLGFFIQDGGNYSHVDYGVIEKEGAGS